MTNLLLAGYVAVFGVAAVACFAGLSRVGRVDDPDTRRGLTGLLVASGIWAAAQALFLLLPGRTLQVAVYTVGLVAGVSTVGGWLYFCSAYTGRTFHRNQTVRRVALAAFLAVVPVKLTNSVHGLYFVVEPATQPFPHLSVRHKVLHWLVMGTSYTLAGVGYFMLLEFFVQTGYDTKPLLVLVAITGLPVALDVVGRSTPFFLEMTYESLGVAAFAVGVLFVYLDRFQAVQLAGDIENAVVFLTDENHVRDANEMARALFPSLEDAVGEPFAQAVPAVADYLDGDSVMEREVDGETRYFRVASTPFTFGGTRVGLMVVLTDVTREEQYRRQIERQNERLGRFASVVSHDLRNPLNVAKGRLELEREHRDSENLEAVSRALHRMERLVSDVLFLAREGVDIGDRSAVSLSESAERAWQSIAAGGASYVQDGDLAVEADDDRLVQLLENLFRNAVEYGGPDVSIHVGSLDDERGFYVEDDGPGIPEGERDDVFEMGVSSGGGTGIGLAIVRTIAEAHGWSVSVTDAVHGEAETPGARFEIFGVDVAGDEAEQADVEAAASGPTSDE